MLKQFPPVKRTTQSPDENTFDSLWSCPLSLSIRVFIKSVTSITNPQPLCIHLVIKNKNKNYFDCGGKVYYSWLSWMKGFLFPLFPTYFLHNSSVVMTDVYSVLSSRATLFANWSSSALPWTKTCKHWKPNKNHLMNKLTKTIYQNEVWYECNFLYCCHYCCWVTACVRVVMLIVLTHLCCKYWYIVRNSACIFNS